MFFEKLIPMSLSLVVLNTCCMYKTKVATEEFQVVRPISLSCAAKTVPAQPLQAIHQLSPAARPIPIALQHRLQALSSSFPAQAQSIPAATLQRLECLKCQMVQTQVSISTRNQLPTVATKNDSSSAVSSNSVAQDSSIQVAANSVADSTREKTSPQVQKNQAAECSSAQSSYQSVSEQSRLQEKCDQGDLDHQQFINQCSELEKTATIDQLRYWIESLVVSKNNMIKELKNKASRPGFTKAREIEFKKRIDQIDLQIRINEIVFHDKVQRLSIGQLRTLKSNLEKQLNNIDLQRKCASNKSAVEECDLRIAAVKARSALVSKLLRESRTECQLANSSNKLNTVPVLSRMVPEYLMLSHNSVAAWLWPNYKIVNKLWDCAYELKEFVEHETSNVLRYVDDVSFDRDEVQRIYENLVRSRVQLTQFYKALCECNSSEHYVTHDKLLAEVRQIDGKLAQVISIIETEKNVAGMSVSAMAERMQYESEKQARQDMHDHPINHILNTLARAYLGNLASAGVGVTYGADKPVEVTIQAGPAAKIFEVTKDPEIESRKSTQAIKDKHAALTAAAVKVDTAAPVAASQSSNTTNATSTPVAQAPNSQAAQASLEIQQNVKVASENSITLQAASSTADVSTEQITQIHQAYTEAQQQLGTLKAKLEHATAPLTADQQQLLTSLNESIITADNLETCNEQQGVLALQFLDLATTTTRGAIEAAQQGNTTRAADFVGVTNALKQIYLVSDLLYSKILEQNPTHRLAMGIVKRMGPNIHGTCCAIAHPIAAIKNFEYALNRLDYFIGRLSQNDPEAWAQIHQKIEEFNALPFGDKFEHIGGFITDFMLFPALINKALALTGSVARGTKVFEAFDRVFEPAADLASKIPEVLAQEEKIKGVIQDFSKIAHELDKTPSVVATTPEGITVTIKAAEELGAEKAAAQGLTALEEVESTKAGGEIAKASTVSTNYSGELIKVPNPDLQAEKLLAQRFKDGKACVKFSNDPSGKEFDIITKDFIVETKPALDSIGSLFRKQAKRAFDAAKQTNRRVYFHFDGQPCNDIIKKLHEYQKRYGVEMIIDTKTLD